MVKTIRWIRSMGDGPVSLPKMLFEEDHARWLDEERWRRLEAEQERQAHGGIVNYGAEAGDQEGSHMHFGGAGVDLPGRPPSPLLETDYTSLDDEAASLPVRQPQVEPDIESVLDDRESKNVTYVRNWPVPGDGRWPRQGQIGPNGRQYSDGRYAPEGGFRGIDPKTGKLKPHYGVDLPAASGTDVVAPDSGVVRESINDSEGFGGNVVLAFDDGMEGVFAHLRPGEALPVGSRVEQGQMIGKVGNSGRARSKGDHLHYELRRAGSRTWKKPSKGGGQRVDPAGWTRRVSRRNPMDD